MKPEQQRIAIAEACGWKHYHEDLWVSPNVTDFSELDCEQLPDYLNDLNAMNSAVLQKFNGPSHEGWAFIDNLRVACGIPHSSTCMALVCATAAQRAEAFLKTLNLWTND
jgi:hypothetical protein